MMVIHANILTLTLLFLFNGPLFGLKLPTNFKNIISNDFSLLSVSEIPNKWATLTASASIIFFNTLPIFHSSVVFADQLNLNDSVEKFKIETYPLNKLFDSLSKGIVRKVIFEGINPKIATVYVSDGNPFVVDLPPDDPLSPAGPSQVIAKVQHTQGVECIQDLSSSIAKLNGKSSFKFTLPLLSHSSYPKTYADNKDEFTGGEDPSFSNRYNGKDELKTNVE